MATMTITEALAEIKTIAKRIEKKREFIRTNLARQEHFKDPLAADGGQKAAIDAAFQSIRDLESNVVSIRIGIMKANLATPITVGGSTRTMAEWLAWRRDVAPGYQAHLKSVATAIDATRNEVTKKGFALVTADGQAQKPTDVVINLNEKALAAEIENLETVLGTLDGQLSLKNATTTVDF